MGSGRLTRSFSPAWRFHIDVAEVGQARVAEALADGGVR